ncbi:MAG: InlB B-repeat-containing protein, partial [Clostridia bacterium]|nr:InlB B-repeat-containing protein [Clostridia bacterium]
SYGAGEYFVLANDIDFAGEAFHPVRNFKGNFYGIGYALKNISCSSWQYWNGSDYVTFTATNYGYGVFCNTQGTVIADLIVENYEYLEIPRTNAWTGNRGACAGGIVGYSTSECKILNCHTSGRISSSVTHTYRTAWGGIIGEHYTTSPITVYRCSANIDTYSRHSGTAIYPMHGGIVGHTDNTSMTAFNIYDCVANLTADCGAPISTHVGAVVGLLYTTTSKIENVVAKSEITVSGGSGTSSSAIAYTSGQTSIKLSNVYVGGSIGASGATKLPLYMLGTQTLTSSNSQLSNLNLVKPSSLSYATGYTGMTNSFTSSSPAQPTLRETFDDLYSKAEQDVDNGLLPSSIWDKSKIGNYTPADSPVRNFLKATVSFKNLLSSGGEEELGIDTAEYRAGDTLPSPSASYLKAYHTFRGWTMDKTGGSEPVTTLPAGVFGEVTFYAVWGLTDSYVKSNITTSLSVKDNIRTIEYDSVASITLTAKATHTGTGDGYMTNPSFTYYWKQDGKDKTNNTTGELNLKVVKDSGEYTYVYRIKDSLEPLWYYDGDYSGNAETVTIEKGKLEHMTIKDFKISSSTVPYFGKKLEDITFTVSMFNNANKEVSLSEVKWQSTIGKVDNKGTNTKKIVLCPADTDNYEEQYVFDATFESQSLVIVFNMAQISQKIEVEVEYGQNYGANEIIYLFEQAYLKALSTWDAEIVGDVSSMAPYLDGKALVDGDANADKFDIDYNGINEIHTIQVTFKDASYEVVFNPNNGGGSSPTQENYGYGQFLKKPNDPVNGDLLFVGWYFDEDYIDDNGNEATRNRAWRFNSVGDIPQDRVTKAVTLIAKWLKADTLDSIKVEVDPSKKYMAQTSLKEGDLIVTATYSGEVDGQTIEQDVVLSWSDFASGIKYSTVDNQMHVTDGGYGVTVEFSYGSTTKSDSILINVLPISVDTSKAKFENKVVIYDGTDKDERIGEVTWS